MNPSKHLVSLSILVACLGLGPVSWAAPEEPAKNSELNRELFYQLLLGELSANNGDAANAYALLLDAARKTNSEKLFERAVELALRARSADAALDAAYRAELMPRSTLTGEANILICPNLDSANILFSVLKMTSGHNVTVGPILLGAAAWWWLA